MSYKNTLELESLRLSQYVADTPCFICGGGNACDTELCRHCAAPMALGQQAAGPKTRPNLITVLGSAGAGKTVYLGMLLDMLSRHAGDLQVLARGAFSVSLQQATVAALARCEFPEKTPNEPERWNWVRCQVRSHRKKPPVELIVPDMAGEAVAEEFNHPGSFPTIRAYLEKCGAAMILIDAARLEAGCPDQDYFAMKALSYVLDLNSDRRRGWPTRPLAVVFTKHDQCESCSLDPESFAERHTPGLWKHCRERFPKHRFFSASVVGATAERLEPWGRVAIPLRVEPRGVIDPFRWLVTQFA